MKPKVFKKHSKMIILALGGPNPTVPHCKSHSAIKWVNIAFTCLESHVAQHWGILAKELQYDGKDPVEWQLKCEEALIHSYESVDP